MEAPAVDAKITTLQVFSDESDKQSLYLSFPLFCFWPLLCTPITLCWSWWCIKAALLHDGKKPESMHANGSGIYLPATLLGKIFNCMLTQITAFRHVVAVKTTCWSSKPTSGRRKKDWKWCGCCWVFHKLIYWDHNRLRGFTEDGGQKENKPGEQQPCGGKRLADVKGLVRLQPTRWY